MCVPIVYRFAVAEKSTNVTCAESITRDASRREMREVEAILDDSHYQRNQSPDLKTAGKRMTKNLRTWVSSASTSPNVGASSIGNSISEIHRSMEFISAAFKWRNLTACKDDTVPEATSVGWQLSGLQGRAADRKRTLRPMTIADSPRVAVSRVTGAYRWMSFSCVLFKNFRDFPRSREANNLHDDEREGSNYNYGSGIDIPWMYEAPLGALKIGLSHCKKNKERRFCAIDVKECTRILRSRDLLSLLFLQCSR